MNQQPCKPPSRELIRVRRFRKKAKQTRIEILMDEDLKAWFQSLPGKGHTKKLLALREVWDIRKPEHVAQVPKPNEPDYAELLRERIKREHQDKNQRNHRTDPERSYRQQWREDSHYRDAAKKLVAHLSLPELADCIAQGWGPYLMEYQFLALLKAPRPDALRLVWLIWRGKHEFDDAIASFAGHIPYVLTETLRQEARQRYDDYWYRNHPEYKRPGDQSAT